MKKIHFVLCNLLFLLVSLTGCNEIKKINNEPLDGIEYLESLKDKNIEAKGNFSLIAKDSEDRLSEEVDFEIDLTYGNEFFKKGNNEIYYLNNKAYKLNLLPSGGTTFTETNENVEKYINPFKTLTNLLYEDNDSELLYFINFEDGFYFVNYFVNHYCQSYSFPFLKEYDKEKYIYFTCDDNNNFSLKFKYGLVPYPQEDVSNADFSITYYYEGQIDFLVLDDFTFNYNDPLGYKTINSTYRLSVLMNSLINLNYSFYVIDGKGNLGKMYLCHLDPNFIYLESLNEEVEPLMIYNFYGLATYIKEINGEYFITNDFYLINDKPVIFDTLLPKISQNISYKKVNYYSSMGGYGPYDEDQEVYSKFCEELNPFKIYHKMNNIEVRFYSDFSIGYDLSATNSLGLSSYYGFFMGKERGLNSENFMLDFSSRELDSLIPFKETDLKFDLE